MDNDVISLFLNRKKQNISKYTELLARYTLKNNVRLTKITNKITEIYINNYYLEKNTDFSLLSKYFEINKSKESKIKDVLLSSITFYQNSGLEEQISKDINTIVILSNLIFLGITIDSFTNELKNNDLSIESRVQLFINRYKTKLKIEESRIEEFTNELTTLIKKDVTSEKKFWKCLENNNFFIDYYRTLKENNYYIVKPYYEIKMLNRYDSKEVEKTSYTKGIMDDIQTIYLERLSLFILKNLLYEKYNNKFFVSVDGDYFNKNKDIINCDNIFNNNYIKQRVIFMFNYNDCDKFMNVLKSLNSKGYKLGLINIPTQASLTTTTFDLFEYVFIDSDILEKYKDLEEVWKIKNIKFIIDNDDYIKIEENKILTGTR